jgi:class 3 adenylate cyclase/pimeloyl-ACP methyl ester carboxylesterase
LIAVIYADMVGYSRLIGLDDVGTLERLRALRTTLIDPAIDEHGGRLVNTGGDSLLIVFDSVDGAVRCAVKVQQQVLVHDGDMPPDRAILFRVGINVGDVIPDGLEVHGDVVNVSARLQAECPPGGICVSRAVRDHLYGRLDLRFEELGPLSLKNIARPVEAYLLESQGTTAPPEVANALARRQEIRYCQATDGVRLALAIAGKGPRLFRTANYLNHLEYDWESPITSHLLRSLVGKFTLARYDARGTGLSDWEAADVSFGAWVRDLETIVSAVGWERFPLMGISQGCAVAIAYAVRHPERVSHLILYGGFACGRMVRATNDGERQKINAMETLMRTGWGEQNPAFRQMFTSLFLPDGSREQMDWFNEQQRRTTSPECAARYFRTSNDIDVRHLLPEVSVPTLVLHLYEDAVVPFDLGREIASGIPNARFIPLKGKNHMPLEHDPATVGILEEMRFFLGA